MDELNFPGVVKPGDHGLAVKYVQEWLCLHKLMVKVDGIFGPATAAAVYQFRNGYGQAVVDEETWDNLVTPMKRALAPIEPEGRNLSEMILAWARQQLCFRPKEVGGENCGPWVRLYMHGQDGEWARWCAGFACFCLEKACASLNIPQPLQSSTSVPVLAKRSLIAGMRLTLPVVERSRIKPGSFFLIRDRKLEDWEHIGIVVEATLDHYSTIEGNTNDDGSSNGYGVFNRIRAYGRSDFILF